MIALLRADWLRLRKRRDLWIIAIVVGLTVGIGFVSGYRSDAEDPPPFNAAEYEQMFRDSGFFEGMTQGEIDAARPQLLADAQAQDAQAAAEHEAQQAIALQKYVLPQSLLTGLGSGIAVIVALALAAMLVVGDEFRFGTLRTSLLAAGNRRKFLAARLLSLLVLTVGLVAIVLALTLIMSVGLVLVGAELPPAGAAIDGGASVGLVGAQVLVISVLIALVTLLTVLLRSGALPLLIAILYFLVEAFVGALPAFLPGEPLAGVPQFFPGTAIRTLLGRLQADTGAVVFAGMEVPLSPLALGLPVVAAIVAFWGVVFLVLADRRIRTMDVTE